MIAKIIFSSFHFIGHVKNVKYASRILKSDFRTWTSLHYPVIPFKLSDIGEGIKEVTVKRSFLKPHQKLSQFEDVCEVESDKASVTITSRFDGLVKNVYFKEGDVITVGSTLCDIETGNESADPGNIIVEKELLMPAHENKPIIEEKTKFTHTERNQESAHIQKYPSEQTAEEVHSDKLLATPAVRRIARENNVNLHLLKGTGRGGRIMKEDILAYLNQPPKERFTPVFAEEAEISELVSGYQKVMVRTMTESNRIPTLGLSDEIDVTDLEILRKSIKTVLAVEGIKLSFLAFLVKAVSLSLVKYPILNAKFEGHDTIKYQNSHNIGIAVDTESGLVVPSIKDVTRLNIRQIAKEIQRLQKLADQNKLSIADTAYGTFTISNIGSIAGTVVKPLILPPQVAIVGVGRIRSLPRYDATDQIHKRLVVNVSWAADHRIIDGGTTARFSNLVKQYLENPGLLIVDG